MEDGHVEGKLAARVGATKMLGEGGGAGSVQRHNRERRIQQILLAATEIFRDEGYAGFTTRKVAAKAGLTLSNLQYYFPDKDELLSAIIQNFLQGFLDEYVAIADRSGASAQRRCGALVEQIFADISKVETGKFLFETWAFAQHAPYASTLVEAAYAAYRDIFAELLSEINPALSLDECQVRAFVLTAQAEGMMILSVRGEKSEKDYEEFLRTTKRSVKSIAGLTGKMLGAELFEPARSSTSASATTGVGIFHDLFGAENQERRGRYDLSLRQVGLEQSYLRPTMQSRKREAKINEIIRAAANVLASEGYANFTLARVAKEVGILTSGLQHYFPVHEDLLGSTISALFATYYDRWSEMSQPSAKSAIERLFEVIDEVFVEACDPRVCRFSFEMFALAEHSEITYTLLSKSYAEYRQIYVNLVREIDPTVSGRECLARATLIAAQFEGLMIYTYSTGRQTPGLDMILRLFKATSVEIAHGFTGRNKETVA
ncbi:TetR/AcrR family transcriptional regulator [Burkholderia multivorans]|uniref:TetR/AcrR family transcriptional regulator n=1 Tax=Burkholderia multivorans TaxID=87883 RepID=UPI00207D18A0|nr:TetR/AcrR family transcriptional regulator [Burkholderia multivorans]MCO1463791.1 TetR/AcrR family transcriptional regulator [Burkholderia multivorans]